MKKAILLIVLVVVGFNLTAQEDWMHFPQKNSDTTIKAKQVSLDYASQKGKLTLHEDARLKKLGEFVRTGENSIEGVKINGYRIVIFFDQDKTVVSQQKQILSRYNEHKAYIDYVAPNYRVRVGNFRTKIEAEGLKAELLAYFPTAVVVEDYIQLPELPVEVISD